MVSRSASFMSSANVGRGALSLAYVLMSQGFQLQRGRSQPVGTQRRLQALMARAWSPAAIETASGIPARDIDRMLGDERNATPALAAVVARAYDRLWDRQPPRSTAESREAASAALAHACRRGWAPPLAWDDDQIDHPSGRPADGWKPANGGSGRRSALDLAEDAAWVREYGSYR